MIASMLRVGWHFMSHPMGRRTAIAGILEFAGIGLVLYGLYLLHMLAFIIGLGAILLLISQGLGRSDNDTA
jgi:hypothetical protein